MGMGVAQIKKLRGKSMHELRIRGEQEIAKYGERLLGLSVGEMSDNAFLRQVSRATRAASAEETAWRIVERILASVNGEGRQGLQSFFPLSHRAEIVSVMERRFSRERQAIISRAERAVSGRFDLLGFNDLTFGCPPDWLAEPVSGRRTPLEHWSRIDYLNPDVAGDKKVTWELNRHQHFVTLGQAYWMSGDERYADAFVSQATSWMDENPPNLGINWVSSLELAFRSISWLWALHFFAASPRLTPGFTLRLVKHLAAHAQHIHSYLSSYFSPNTHLTGEALGLLYIGTAVGELQHAEKWRKLGLEILLGEISRQVRSDGVYFEQATYYHRYTADFYTHLLLLGRASNTPLPAQVEEGLAQLLTYLMYITRPDGSSPFVGDDDGGRLIKLGERRLDDFRDTLAVGAALYGRGDWKHVAGDATPEMLWLLGPEALARYDELPGEPPLAQSYAFEASGHLALRDGWAADSCCALIDCGPHGALSFAHAHADALSFEFAAQGKAFIVDPGTFTYTADLDLRNSFRTTEAHNTVLVDGQSQSVPAGPFSWGDVARTSLDDFILGQGFDYFVGTHTGYERLPDPVTHTRALVYPKRLAGEQPADGVPSYLVVDDTLKTAGRHRYEIRYHLSPDCSAYASGNEVLVTEPGGGRLKISVFGQSNLRARIDAGWVSRAYGRREPAPVVTFEVEAEGTQQFTTFLMSLPENSSVQVEQEYVSGGAARGFRVLWEQACDLLMLNENSGAIQFGPLSAEGTVAWARFVGDSFARAFLIGGRRLQTADGFAFRSDSAVRQCAVRNTADGVEGSVDGGELFNLSPGACAGRLVINGATFEMSPDTAVTAGDSRKWSMVNAG